MVNTLYLPELREMLAEDDTRGMQEFFAALHPARAAEFMEGLEPAEAWQVLRHADPTTQEEVFQYFDLDRQAEVLRLLPPEEAGDLIARLAPDDRVDVLKELEPSRVSELLAAVPTDDRRDILRLTAYPETTAGAVMTSAFARIRGDLTARQALDEVATQAAEAELETIYYLYVVDEENHLEGVISARDLMGAMGRPSVLVRDLADRNVVSVRTTDDQEEVARKVAQFNLLAIPVVDAEHHIVGIITHDDVMDVLVDEATEDAHRMGGVGPITEDILKAKFLTVWRKRAVWLSLLFIAELFTFSALAHFESAIEAVVALSLFVPLVLSTGGNSGSQAATLITRALALGQVTVGNWFRVLYHEVLMGIALGCTLGVIGFLRAILTPESILGSVRRFELAAVIGASVAAICLWGTLVGSLLPLLFRRLGIDPGFASSPFVATFVDVTGIVIYFSIAQLYLL